MEVLKAIEKKQAKNKKRQPQKQEAKLRSTWSPYICDLCDFRRNKDSPKSKGFKCNTGKRRLARYKGCPDFQASGRPASAFIGKAQKAMAWPEAKKKK